MAQFAIKSADFDGRTNRALARLAAATPEAWAGAEATGDWAALLAFQGVLSGYLCEGTLTETTSPEGFKSLRVEVKTLFGRGERYEAARALWAPVVAFGALSELLQPSVGVDVGALPVAIVVGAGVMGIAVVLGQTALGAYAVNQAGQFVSNVFQRNKDSSDAQKAQAAALQAVAAHVAREKEAGKTLPLDEATKATLETLQATSKALVERKYTQDAGILESPKNAPPWYSNPWTWGAAAAGLGLVTVLAVAMKGRQ
jgi:hypothetical protein